MANIELKITILENGFIKCFETISFKNESIIEKFLNDLKEYSNNLEMIEYSFKKTIYNFIAEITYQNHLYSFFLENDYKSIFYNLLSE